MNLFLIWLFSLLSAIVLSKTCLLSCTKYNADRGYIPTLPDIYFSKTCLKKNTFSPNLASFIGANIPFLNILLICIVAYFVTKKQSYFLESRIADGSLTKMTAQEFYDYKKKPTYKNLKKIVEKSNFFIKQALKNAPSIEDCLKMDLIDGSTVFYYYIEDKDREIKKMVITHIQGIATNYSKKEIEKLIKIKEIINLKTVIQKYGPSDSMDKSEIYTNDTKQYNTPISSLESEENKEEKPKQKIYTKNNNHKF